MGSYVFRLPDIGEGIAESEIAQWRVAVGDAVSEDQPLVDMLTEKAAVEIPSPVAGRVVAIHGQAGDKIAVGAQLVTLEVAGAAPADTAVPVHAASVPVSATAAAVTNSEGPVPASPATRQRARELGVDLHQVTASGKHGRVLREDVERHVAAAAAPEATAAHDDEGSESIKLIGVRRKIAEAMQRASQRIPHFAYVEEVDVTELEALRQRFNARYSDRVRLTLLPLLIEALVKTLPDYPQVNATYDDEAGVLTRHRALHVGIATQTSNGLVVPVLRHAQRLNLWQRATEIRRLAEAARENRATRAELSGSTLTLSSLGALGGLVSTPIINAPEVAIIGVNRMLERPVVRNGALVVRTMMNLSSSFDHRIVDGFDAASFIQQLKALLEDPVRLFVDPTI